MNKNFFGENHLMILSYPQQYWLLVFHRSKGGVCPWLYGMICCDTMLGVQRCDD